jgi:ribonuclease HI
MNKTPTVTNKIRIFSDGSVEPNPGVGAWACIVIYPDGKEVELSGKGEGITTNNVMELTAALEGLRSVRQPSQIILLSDSQYLIKAFTERWITKWRSNNYQTGEGKRANWELWEKLYTISRYHEVEWKWVRGHTGNVYNERCDRLAAKARGVEIEEPSTPPIQGKLKKGALYSIYRAICYQCGKDQEIGDSSQGRSSSLLKSKGWKRTQKKGCLCPICRQTTRKGRRL